MLLKIFVFFKDIIKARYDFSYTGSLSTYYIMRYLYFISDGLLLKLIEFFLIRKRNFKKNLMFLFKNNNPTYKLIKKIKGEEIDLIINEITKMDTIEGNEKKKIRFLNNKERNLNKIDFNYYKNNKIVRLNFERNQLIHSNIIATFINNFLNEDFIKNAEDFANCNLHLMGINSWITLPIPSTQINSSISKYDQITKLYDAQQWHRDCDNLRDIKIFIYLSDVNDQSDGCFQIVENSNNFSFFSPFRYYNHRGFRVPNSTIINKYKSSIYSFFGNKGTSFLADTRALHRGLAITKKKMRFMLEIYFSNHLFGQDKKYIIKKEHESYNTWKKMVSKNYELYSTLFKKETLIDFANK